MFHSCLSGCHPTPTKCRVPPISRVKFGIGEGRRFEIAECLVTSIVRDMLVHQAPKPLDRIQMRAIGRNEVALDPAPWSRQPSLHQLGVVVAGIVQKQMDQPLARIHRLDRPHQHDRADRIHCHRLDHQGFAGLEINRAVDVQALAAAGLFDRD
jgi:hypothetical protein